jgi:hypothetical protein
MVGGALRQLRSPLPRLIRGANRLKVPGGALNVVDPPSPLIKWGNELKVPLIKGD